MDKPYSQKGNVFYIFRRYFGIVSCGWLCILHNNLPGSEICSKKVLWWYSGCSKSSLWCYNYISPAEIISIGDFCLSHSRCVKNGDPKGLIWVQEMNNQADSLINSNIFIWNNFNHMIFGFIWEKHNRRWKVYGVKTVLSTIATRLTVKMVRKYAWCSTDGITGSRRGVLGVCWREHVYDLSAVWRLPPFFWLKNGDYALFIKRIYILRWPLK